MLLFPKSVLQKTLLKVKERLADRDIPLPALIRNSAPSSMRTETEEGRKLKRESIAFFQVKPRWRQAAETMGSTKKGEVHSRAYSLTSAPASILSPPSLPQYFRSQ